MAYRVKFLFFNILIGKLVFEHNLYILLYTAYT